MPQPTNDTEIPRFGSSAQSVHGWCLEAVQEGESWLKAQRPSIGWERALQVLSADDAAGGVADGLSSLQYNKTKRVARELVAGLANFRHEGEFAPVWDNKLYDAAHTLTNLDRNWYRETHPDRAHRAALQYATGLGTAYLLETWDKHFHSQTRGDIRLAAYGPQDITFVQLPKNHDIQRAYAVLIREELPLNVAKAIYQFDNPAFAASLVPDRDAPGWMAKGLQKLQQFVSPALRVAGRMGGDNNNRSSFPTVDIFHMYVMDATVNQTGHPVEMGPKGTNWTYRVPSVGDAIPTEFDNPATGNKFTVPAGPESCRLFPLRRYVIFSRTAMGFDSSSPWWHGDVPLARISLGDWAWEALGSSVVPELKSMQDGIVALMRGMEDSAAAKLDPPAIYDDQQVSSTWAQSVNPRKAGVRAAANFNQYGDPMKYLVDPHFYDVPPWIPQFISDQEERMDYIASVKDLVAIAKAKQVPGADTLEKLLEMSGPIVQDNIRRLEEPLQQLGEWRKAYYFQFYTRARMITTTGPEGIDINTQYRPEMLVGLVPNETPESRVARSRRSIDDFKYVVTESGINEIHRMTNKLLYIQLQKAGFPISPWTIAKVCQIPNFGPPPEGTNTEIERWLAWKLMEGEIAVDQQAAAAAEAAEQGMLPGGPGGEGSPDGGGAPGGNGGPPSPGGAPEGRPASFNAAPRLQSKDGGSRSTISTSR